MTKESEKKMITDTKSPEGVQKPKRTRQQRRTKVTRQRLMDAARQVFAEKGLDLTTIDEITERADVGKGTFYYHFKSKERLIRELIKAMLGELGSTIDKKCSGVEDLPDLLDSLIGAHIEFFSNRWEDFVLFFQGRADLTLQEGYQGLETPFIDYLEYMEELVDSAIKYRLSKPVLRRIGCAVAGFVSGYYSFAVIASEGEDVDATLRSLRGALVGSLARFIKEAAPAGESGDNSRVAW
jgi:AcrR family transcriptional regulator